MNPNLIPLIGDILAKAAQFEAGQPITITIPTEQYTFDAGALGKVQITESGAVLTIKKA